MLHFLALGSLRRVPVFFSANVQRVPLPNSHEVQKGKSSRLELMAELCRERGVAHLEPFHICENTFLAANGFTTRMDI